MAQTSTCPALQDLAAFLLGRLPADEAVTVAQHLAACDLCRATVQSLSGTSRTVGRVVPADGPTPRERLTAAEVVKMLRSIEEGRSSAVQPMRPASRRRSFIRSILIAFLIGAIGVASFWYGPEITRFNGK
jgi:anti-sigma factor RsiW